MEASKYNKTLILGKLDEKTLLVATPDAFVIKERVVNSESENWKSRYYYTELGDAIRGYARHLLRRPEEVKQLDGSLKCLIDKITQLENTIKQIGKDLAVKLTERLKDPVESHWFKSGSAL